MKATRNDPPVVIPPPTFTLELSQDEAIALLRVTDRNLSVAELVAKLDGGERRPIDRVLGSLFCALSRAEVLRK